MRKKLTLPVLILLSVIGLALQYWYQQTAFDVLSLPVSGSLSALVLKVFAGLCAVIALWLTWPLWGSKPTQNTVLHHGLSRPGMAVGMLAGVLTTAGGMGKLVTVLRLALHYRSVSTVVNVLVNALLVAAGAAMLCLTAASRRDAAEGPALAPLVPGFAGCFWLAVYYHANSQDPVVSHYGWVLVALMCFILACYYQAGYSFNRCRPFRAQLFTCLAAVLLFTAIPSADSLFDRLLLAGCGVWMLLSAAQINRRSEVRGSREA